jgi:hypothetical protein
MVSRVKTIHHGFRAINREIAMEFKHGVCGVNQIGSVDLDLVVVLRMRNRRSGDESQKCDCEKATMHKVAAKRDPMSGSDF